MKNLIQNSEPASAFGSTAKKLQKTLTLGVCALVPLTGMLAVSQAAPQAPNSGFSSVRYERSRDWRNDRDGRNDRRGDRRRQDSFVGRVTKVHSATSFDIRVDDHIFNVYLDSRVPRRLDERDLVRVDGVRMDNNDIRDASVTILNNR